MFFIGSKKIKFLCGCVLKYDTTISTLYDEKENPHPLQEDYFQFKFCPSHKKDYEEFVPIETFQERFVAVVEKKTKKEILYTHPLVKGLIRKLANNNLKEFFQELPEEINLKESLV